MKDEYEDDLYVECAACGGGVRRSESFHEDHRDYHPDCAGVWQCSNCGAWNDKGKPCQGCGEEKKP
jgi:hypothetical protein